MPAEQLNSPFEIFFAAGETATRGDLSDCYFNFKAPPKDCL
jgi:hypothetical protein